MDSLRAVVERITYYNEDNGYAVLKCAAKGFIDLVTVVGNMAEINVGSVLSMTGEWKVDPKYGRQFSVFTYEETLPATVYGIEKYLGSGLVKGIGPHFAKRITQHFGENTLEVIESDPDRLLEIPGIGKKRVDQIKVSWAAQKEIKNIMLFLQGHDVSTAHATKIYKQYGAESIDIVKENPYRLADDIWGIGFKTADTIATKLGFAKDAYVRLRSGLMYTLNKLSEEGHCFSTRDMLIDTGVKLLEVEADPLTQALDTMIHDEDVFTDRRFENEDTPEMIIYLPPFYHSEKGTAKRLTEIYKAPSSIKSGVQLNLDVNIQYDPIQLQAIETAVSSKITVLIPV